MRRLQMIMAGLFLTGVLPVTASAEDYFVETQRAYNSALKRLDPGDTIVLKDGEWPDFKIVFEGKGTQEENISLRAETPGGVVLTGQSNLRVGGAFLHVSGLVFRDGYTPSRVVIDMRSRKYDTLILSELSDITIDDYSKPGTDDKDYWVNFRGIGNRLTRSAFLNKTSLGSTIIVTQTVDTEIPGQHMIAENYFGPRPPLGKNGGETIRIGNGKVAHQRFDTRVIRNYFERCNGEAEIISIKSGGNVISENMFVEAGGAVTFRQGDDNLVSRNIFLGMGSKRAGGVRLTSFNQTVRDNYFEGLRGRGRSAVTFMDGFSDTLPVHYRQVQNARIHNNTFVDISTLTFGRESNNDGDWAPLDSVVTGNLFLSSPEERSGHKVALSINTDISGISFDGNAGNAGGLEELGIAQSSELEMARSEVNGLYYVTNAPGLAELGAPQDLKPFARAEVGPSYFDPSGE